jgi:D-sedoheptulose 7-phosphate isomerase
LSNRKFINQLKTIRKDIDLILNAYKNGNKVIVFGNGGSAVDSEHFVTELVSKFYLNRKGLNAIALSSNSAILTAIGNDFDYSEVFSRQVVAYANSGDIVVGISTSGKSENVLKGLDKAQELNAIPVLISGNVYSPYGFHIKIDSNNTPRIQEAYLLVLHIIAEEVERNLFNE